ncbi:MAG: hypothetical protein ABI602_02185 [Candidatus Saccharibacteria bacterium]
MKFETNDDSVKIVQATTVERDLLRQALTNRLVSAASGGTKLTHEMAVFLVKAHHFNGFQALVFKKASNLLLVAECLMEEMPRYANETLPLATTMVQQLKTEAIVFDNRLEMLQWTPESFT